MPYFCRSLVSQALNHAKQRSLKGSRVLILGVAYKPDIGDMRESPALKLISLLQNAGATVSYHDPHVPRFDEHGLQMESVPLDPAAYDVVVIVTDHHSIDYEKLVDDAEPRRRPPQRHRQQREPQLRQGLQVVMADPTVHRGLSPALSGAIRRPRSAAGNRPATSLRPCLACS